MRSSRYSCRCGLIAVLVAWAALTSVPAAAQGTASIIGQVTDESGAVLPGVTVTATSPALQVPQVTAITNEVGEYRLAPLPIGVFEAIFELAGFQQARRESIRLTVGFTARIDVALKLAAVAESVTVSGAAPVVDVTSTSADTLLTREMMDLTPTSRSGIQSLVTMAPGVRSFLDVGGSQIADNPTVRSFGQSGAMWYTIEGVPSQTLLTRGDGQGANWDYQTIDEARVQTLGTDAEAPTRGVQLNAVVKSGGNEFHGNGSWAQSNQHFQSNNIDQALADIGLTSGNAIAKRYDFSGDLGGRIIRNKLWFYGSGRRRGHAINVLQAFKPDGSPAQETIQSTWHTEKVSFQLNPSNRFIGFSQSVRQPEENKITEQVSYEARQAKVLRSRYSKGAWEGVRGNSLIATVQFGAFNFEQINLFVAGGEVGRLDLVTDRRTGEFVVSGANPYASRRHTMGSVTWYRPNWFHGNHEFKVGFDYRGEEGFRSLVARPPNYYLLLSDGAPFEVAFMNGPTFPRQRANMIDTYVKDSWTIGRRLTLNLGVRFDRQDAFSAEHCREAAAPPSDPIFPAECYARVELPVFNSVAPRVHAAYDVSGDGKTVVKGGWGRFYDMRHLYPDITRVTRDSVAYGIFRWHDLNGNLDYDDGEVNRDVNGPDYVESQGNEFESYQPPGVPNPNEKQPYYNEYSMTLEREVAANVSLRATGAYSQVRNVFRVQNNLRTYESYNVPVTNRDPGPDGRVGTADDGGLFTYWEFPVALGGRQHEEVMAINDPRADANFGSVEVALIKRLAKRWQFMASYSATKKDRPIIMGLTSGATFGQSSIDVGNYTPNDEINRADHNWDWDAKAVGTYIFPYDILVGANFEHRSGDPYARQVQFRGGKTIPAIVLNAEPLGTRRLPNINLLTLRVEKSFQTYAAHRLAVRVNVYNALNANTVTANQPRAGAQFLRPRAIMLPRIAELSASYTF